MHSSTFFPPSFAGCTQALTRNLARAHTQSQEAGDEAATCQREGNQGQQESQVRDDVHHAVYAGYACVYLRVPPLLIEGKRMVI